MAGSARPTARIFGIVAAEARVAVVLRRGPSKQVAMLRWDLATDEVVEGQWLSGRVYEERCDLSPNGELLVYFVGKFKGEIPTYTAISRPPYFTALALWREVGTYGGGGRFESDRRVALASSASNLAVAELNGGVNIPADFEVVSMADVRGRTQAADGGERPRHGYTTVQTGRNAAPTETMSFVYDPPWIEGKASPLRAGPVLQRVLLGMFEQNGPSSVHSYRLVTEGAPPVDLGRLDWADWDHDGSLLYATEGRLFRRDLRSPAPPKLVADLAPLTFRRVPPTPAAQQWPRSRRR